MMQRVETRLDGTTLVVRIPMRFQRRGGRKGRGQGQCGPEQHAPDPELGKRIPGDEPHTLRCKAG
jgi:hypothetical protein